MKLKLITLSILVYAFIISVSLNSAPYGMAGCGLGSLIISENKMGSQIVAGFLNLTGTQTSGITTGTSNCTTSGVVNKDKEQEVFVHLNYESLEREMATGKGEKLDTLASLFGCSNSSEFNKMTKTNYKNLFKDSEIDPSNLLIAIRLEVQKSDSLKNSCKL